MDAVRHSKPVSELVSGIPHSIVFTSVETATASRNAPRPAELHGGGNKEGT